MEDFSRDQVHLEKLITHYEKKASSLCLLRGLSGWAMEFLFDCKDVEIWEAPWKVIAQGLNLFLELSYATQT